MQPVPLDNTPIPGPLATNLAPLLQDAPLYRVPAVTTKPLKATEAATARKLTKAQREAFYWPPAWVPHGFPFAL